MCIVRRFLDRNLRNIVPSNSSLSSLVNVFQSEYCVVVLGIVTPHQTVLPLTNHQSGRDNWSSPPINKFTIYFSYIFSSLVQFSTGCIFYYWLRGEHFWSCSRAMINIWRDFAILLQATFICRMQNKNTKLWITKNCEPDILLMKNFFSPDFS